jgi:uncharacterized protein
LEDTLIGFRLPGYTKTEKRKAISRSKHYLFDVGVSRYLAKTGRIEPGGKTFGDALEHFIILETRAFLSYTRNPLEMRYWRSTSKFEVDLVIGDEVAIEIKASHQPTDRSLKGLRSLKEERIFQKYILVCASEEERRTADGIRILPWKQYVRELWSGAIVSGGREGARKTGLKIE